MCVTRIGRPTIRVVILVALLAFLILFAGQPVGSAETPTTPTRIARLIFVTEPNETPPITRLREATVARYTAGGLYIITVVRADIDKWIAANAHKTAVASKEFGLILFARSMNADAIAGITHITITGTKIATEPDGSTNPEPTEETLGFPWLINLRRASTSASKPIDNVTFDTEPIDFSDYFDAHRPVIGQPAPPDVVTTTSEPEDGALDIPIQRDLQPRQPFVIYSDYFSDEPLPDDRIRPEGNPDRPFIGIMFDSAKRGENDARPRVLSVIPGSPAELSGLQPGDVLLSINGSPTSTLESMADFVGNSAVREPLNFEVERGDETTNVEVRPTTIRDCYEAADRTEREQIESIVNMLATGGTLKDANGPAAPIPDLRKRLAVIQFIRPSSFEEGIPRWARSRGKLPFAPMLSTTAPILQMLELNNPNRVTWITITVGGDEARWRDWINAAADPGLQFYWQDPPATSQRLLHTIAPTPTELFIVRSGKLVRKTDVAYLPLVLKRLTSGEPSTRE